MTSSQGADSASGGGTYGRVNPAALWLAAVGVGIQSLAVLMIVAVFGAFPAYGSGMLGIMGHYGGMMGQYYGSGTYGWAWLWLAIALAAIAVGVVGVLLMNSEDPGRLRSGAVLVLFSAVLAFPTMWGFGAGSILMFIGAILGLTTVSGPRR